MAVPCVLVDGNNLLYRSHFGLRQLVDSSQRPTGILYGFLRSLLDLKVVGAPVVVWDYGLPQDLRQPCWRQAVLDHSYKQNRVPLPEPDQKAIALQRPVLDQFLNLLGYPSIGISGLEADDVIGLLVGKLNALDRPIVIHSTDHDYYQLVIADRVELMCPQPRGGVQRITEGFIQDVHGVSPRQWPLVMAIGGDAGDNFKPIRGVGQRTAIQWVRAGLRPDTPKFGQLPPGIQKQFLHLRGIWTRIHQCYRLAKIHSTWQPEFPADCCTIFERRAAMLATYNGPHVSSDYDDVLETFTRRSVEYDLHEFIAKRRQFVNR